MPPQAARLPLQHYSDDVIIPLRVVVVVKVHMAALGRWHAAQVHAARPRRLCRGAALLETHVAALGRRHAAQQPV